MHGGKSPRGPRHPRFKHGKYSKALPQRLLRDFDELRANPELVSLEDELALIDLRLVQLVTEQDWAQVDQLVEVRRRLAGTEARLIALRATTMTEQQTMTLIAAVVEALRRHVADPQAIDAVGREVERLLGV